MSLSYEGSEGDQIRLLNETTVETIALIEQIIKAKDHVQAGIDAEEYYRIKDSEKKTE